MFAIMAAIMIILFVTYYYRQDCLGYYDFFLVHHLLCLAARCLLRATGGV